MAIIIKNKQRGPEDFTTPSLVLFTPFLYRESSFGYLDLLISGIDFPLDSPSYCLLLYITTSLRCLN